MRFFFTSLLLIATSLVAAEPTSKAPIPDEESQKAAATRIAEVYKPDYAKAKSAMQKVELAQKLFKEAQATKDDLASRYTLLRIARDIAAQQGDLVTAIEAIDLLASGYEVEQLSMKLEAASAAVKAVKPQAASKICVELILPIVADAISEDRYDTAQKLTDLALTSARSVRDAALVKDLSAKLKEIEAAASSYQELSDVVSQLVEKPTDPDANLAVGRFHCFVKGDWERGVPMLALGNDAELKKLAIAELRGSENKNRIDNVELGDAWWDYGESLSAGPQRSVRGHAAALYGNVFSQLAGLNKKRVEQRLTAAQAPPFSRPIVNLSGMELKLLPPGTFTMGSTVANAKETPHQVTITKPFYLAVFEVTQEQYAFVMNANPSKLKGPKNPVTNVSWEEAQEFCRRLSANPLERAARRVYRLPTEAEWEYACRAGTTAEFSFGEDQSQLVEYGWFKDNANSRSFPVVQRKPNPWGLHDMHGNVAEWCQDLFGEYLKIDETDPSGPTIGSKRITRGGSYLDAAPNCRSAARSGSSPETREPSVGFRVVMVVNRGP